MMPGKKGYLTSSLWPDLEAPVDAANNVHRDLVKLVAQLPEMCDPSRITLRKSAAEVAVPIEGVPADEHAYTITLPHELFSSIYHNYKAAWSRGYV